ncbi:glycosyltransferase [Sinorhizobium numidicum]|uniref:Glycosyltransferase n=1 Tax=Sinorhizobium numidicum TaxID=680248 RepID=A0ABY8CUT4_9HYPH|nr:glycosyltransferase family 2 protein [Sinorhizobium numidicum]WEX75091.1 glycosyltransferase [Sinorhizobium numidicum]WEX81085.1 glycosyltransferase [Sinorhizobium numidicum]
MPAEAFAPSLCGDLLSYESTVLKAKHKRMRVCDVSVVIPTYNRASLLRRALNSVVQQTARPTEVIVVDDCSEESILQDVKCIVSDFPTDLNIKLILNDKNLGANHARNKGIFAAGGRYIAFLDSDDLWLPEKLKQQLDAIEKAKAANEKPVLSATGRYRVDDRGEIIARQFGGNVLNDQKIRKSNFIGTLSSVVVEAGIARQVRGFNETLPASQDWDFFIRLSDHVQYVAIAEPLCVYVDHSHDRITLNYRKKLLGHIAMYRNHIRRAAKTDETIKAEFLQNITEDYQELGNRSKAASFFASSIALKRCPAGPFRAAAECVLRGYFRIFPPPSLRQRRYSRYRCAMDRLLQDESIRAQVSEHRDLIQKLMA